MRPYSDLCFLLFWIRTTYGAAYRSCTMLFRSILALACTNINISFSIILFSSFFCSVSVQYALLLSTQTLFQFIEFVHTICSIVCHLLAAKICIEINISLATSNTVFDGNVRSFSSFVRTSNLSMFTSIIYETRGDVRSSVPSRLNRTIVSLPPLLRRATPCRQQ